MSPALNARRLSAHRLTVSLPDASGDGGTLSPSAVAIATSSAAVPSVTSTTKRLSGAVPCRAKPKTLARLPLMTSDVIRVLFHCRPVAPSR